MKIYRAHDSRFLFIKQQLKLMIHHAFKRRYKGYIDSSSYELFVSDNGVTVKENLPIRRLGSDHYNKFIIVDKMKVKLGITMKENPYKRRRR